VVALETILVIVFLTTMMLVMFWGGGLVMVAGKHLTESVAEVFDTTRLGELGVEFIVTVMAVRDVLRMLSLIIMFEGIILVVSRLIMVDEAFMSVRVRIFTVLLLLVVTSVMVVLVDIKVMDGLAVVARLVVRGLLKDTLKSHAVCSKCVAGSLRLKGKHTS